MGAAGAAQAAAPETVPVGDPGNKADTTGFGAVAYEYRIGKYEVTNAEYCEFLGAVAKSDPHKLYDPRMNGGPENWGGIRRGGSSGSYTYTVREGMDKKPVNYTFNGNRVKVPDHGALAAGKAVKWVLPSENEWYKAAYYDPSKPGGAGYWAYAVKGGNAPKCNINTHWPTDVGSYAPSPYGTCDQNGNVWEYNDSRHGNKVGLRGGSFVLRDITVKNCVFRRLASGFWTNSPDNFNKGASYIYNFANLTFERCLFEEGYQWQFGIRGVDGGAVRNCVTHDIGRGFGAFNGVAGAMFFRCKDWVFEDSEWGFVSIGLGSGDGEAFDFEGNCDDMTMRNCLFHDTDGPGFLLCCYASDGHPHTGIRMENCVLNGTAKRPIRLPRCDPLCHPVVG